MGFSDSFSPELSIYVTRFLASPGLVALGQSASQWHSCVESLLKFEKFRANAAREQEVLRLHGGFANSSPDSSPVPNLWANPTHGLL
jgi:hypothetical protein